MTLDEELWIKNQNSSVWEPLVIWIWNGIVKDGLSVLLGLKCSILPLISNFSLQFAHVWNPTFTIDSSYRR